MQTFTKQLQVSAPGKSTQEFTSAIEEGLRESSLREGTVTVADLEAAGIRIKPGSAGPGDDR